MHLHVAPSAIHRRDDPQSFYQTGSLDAKIQIPLDTSRLSDISKVPEGTKAVVLLACGSYSPPTVMHVRIFETARDYFRSMKGIMPCLKLSPRRLHNH